MEGVLFLSNESERRALAESWVQTTNEGRAAFVRLLSNPSRRGISVRNTALEAFDAFEAFRGFEVYEFGQGVPDALNDAFLAHQENGNCVNGETRVIDG